MSPIVDIARDSSTAVDTATVGARDPQLSSTVRYLLAGIRIALGWVFLWAFLDKLFGLGISTPAAKSWLNGGNPTKGLLSASEGPFAGFLHALAGNGVVNVLFIAALLGLGAALILRIGMRLALPERVIR